MDINEIDARIGEIDAEIEKIDAELIKINKEIKKREPIRRSEGTEDWGPEDFLGL